MAKNTKKSAARNTTIAATGDGKDKPAAGKAADRRQAGKIRKQGTEKSAVGTRSAGVEKKKGRIGPQNAAAKPATKPADVPEETKRTSKAGGGVGDGVGDGAGGETAPALKAGTHVGKDGSSTDGARRRKREVLAPPRRLKALYNLKRNECVFPYGDPRDKRFGFCGRKALPDKPYCEGHCNEAYMPTNRSRRRAQDERILHGITD